MRYDYNYNQQYSIWVCPKTGDTLKLQIMTDTPKGNFDWEMIGNHDETMDSRHLQLSISQEAQGW
jgi:hypothetical protein